MKKYALAFVCCLIFTSQSKIDLKGKWRSTDNGGINEITFYNDLYKEIKLNDDLVIETTGQYFINNNPNRGTFTVSLIPDVQFIDGDTIFLECKNLDILKISNNSFVVKSPTQWLKQLGKLVRLNKASKHLWKFLCPI